MNHILIKLFLKIINNEQQKERRLSPRISDWILTVEVYPAALSDPGHMSSLLWAFALLMSDDRGHGEALWCHRSGLMLTLYKSCPWSCLLLAHPVKPEGLQRLNKPPGSWRPVAFITYRSRVSSRCFTQGRRAALQASPWARVRGQKEARGTSKDPTFQPHALNSASAPSQVILEQKDTGQQRSRRHVPHCL